MHISTRVVLSIAVMLSAGASAAALAAPKNVDEGPTKIVNFRDLDLGTADGARTLYGRIASAARTVCRDADRLTTRICRNHAIEAAVNRVGNPLLTSIHRSASERVEGVVRR